MLSKIKLVPLKINRILRYAFLVLVGILFWIVILFISTLSIPAYVYRWIIVKIVAPFFRPNIGKIVSVLGQIHATEFTKLRKGLNIPSRLAIVVNCVLEGTPPLENVIQLIESKWIQARFSNGTLKYPEFQQYIDSWMGFMFFKKVKNFQLKDHIYLHKLNENGSEKEAEDFLQNLTEELVNKPFPFEKSPWELHLIQNYRNSELDCEEGKMSTAFIFRIHHAMGDGFAAFHIVFEALGGYNVAKLGIANQKPATKPIQKNCFYQFLRILSFPSKFLSESGFLVMMLLRKKTPWHIPDRKKTGKQIYGRSPLIPIGKIKFIKDRLGVTFTSVLVTCTTGASAEMMTNSMSGPPSKIVYCAAVPIDRNRKTWRNKSVGVVLNATCDPDMDFVSRLKECEYGIQFAKQSVQVLIERIVLPLFSLQLAVVTRYLLRHRFISIIISNFPGPSVQVDFNGMKVSAMEVTAGALDGQTGIMFTTISYDGRIRICALAENAILAKEEMEELIEKICLMIDKLYLIAKNESGNVKIRMETE